MTVDVTCQTTETNNPDIAGITHFHGALAPDGIVRGRFTHSRAPGGSGTAAMMRI